MTLVNLNRYAKLVGMHVAESGSKLAPSRGIAALETDLSIVA